MSNPGAPTRGRDTARRGRNARQSGSTLRWAIVFGVIALVIVAVVLLLTRGGRGEQFADLGQEHIGVGTAVAYNSDPPTSGGHLDRAARWGIIDGVAPDQALVHNLEHGGVVIYYEPSRVTGDDLNALKQQVLQLSTINHRIVLVQRPAMSSAIAMTAWTYLERLDSYDPDAVEAFFNSHVGKGPECTPNCPT